MSHHMYHTPKTTRAKFGYRNSYTCTVSRISVPNNLKNCRTELQRLQSRGYTVYDVYFDTDEVYTMKNGMKVCNHSYDNPFLNLYSKGFTVHDIIYDDFFD